MAEPCKADCAFASPVTCEVCRGSPTLRLHIDTLRRLPYSHVFLRALLQAGIRTAFFKQLAMGGGASILLAVILTEGLMSWATSSAVGLRARKDHLRHFDAVWACGAMLGVFAAILAMHLVYCSTGHENLIAHCLISVPHQSVSTIASTTSP